MRPYYEHNGILIYHGDCREVLPMLEPVEMLVTDPPYVGLKGGVERAACGGVAARRSSRSLGDEWDASLDWVPLVMPKVELGAAVFCSHHCAPEVALAFQRWDRIALLSWYKRNSPVAVRNAPRQTVEFCWLFKKAPGLAWKDIRTTMVDVPLLQAGCMAKERFVDPLGKSLHPCQKPVSVMAWPMAVKPKSILDPFMGTGTSLRAAKDLGISAVGIDTEEKYCEIAARRLEQECLFFEEPEVSHV